MPVGRVLVRHGQREQGLLVPEAAGERDAGRSPVGAEAVREHDLRMAGQVREQQVVPAERRREAIRAELRAVSEFLELYRAPT